MASAAGFDHERRVKAALESAFPMLTSKQILAIVSFSKLVKSRSRNNNALHPLVRRVFGDKFKAKFIERVGMTTRGKQYTALECTVLNQQDGKLVPDSSQEEGESEE